MRNEDGAKAGAKIVDYTTIIPQETSVTICFFVIDQKKTKK